MDIKIQSNIDAYGEKLKELNNICKEANEKIIVAKTNIENLTKKKEELESNCKKLVKNLDIDDIPKYVKEQEAIFKEFMDELSKIDIDNITEQDVEKLNNIYSKIKDSEDESTGA